MLYWVVDVVHKGCFYMNLIKITFTKVKIIDIHIKFALELELLIGVGILTWH